MAEFSSRELCQAFKNIFINHINLYLSIPLFTTKVCETKMKLDNFPKVK